MAEKGTHFYRFFLKYRPTFATWKFCKNGPMFSDIFVEKGTHVLGFLVKKLLIRVAHPCLSLRTYPPMNQLLLTYAMNLLTQPISFPQRDCTAVWLLTSR